MYAPHVSYRPVMEIIKVPDSSPMLAVTNRDQIPPAVRMSRLPFQPAKLLYVVS